MNRKSLAKAANFFLFLGCKASNEIDEISTSEEAECLHSCAFAWWRLESYIDNILWWENIFQKKSFLAWQNQKRML